MNPNEKSEAPKPNTAVGVAVTVLVLVWLVGVTFVVQFGAWIGSAFPVELLHLDNVNAQQIYFGAALIQAFLLLLPLVPLVLFWKSAPFRGAFRVWLAGALFLLLLAPARLVPNTFPQLMLLLEILFALIFSGALWALTGNGKLVARGSLTAIGAGITLGLLFALPWLRWGALGSPFDVLLGIVAALTFALAAILVILRLWLRAWTPQNETGAAPALPRRALAFGGLVVGGLLLVMTSGYGFSGNQFLLMLEVGSFGWLVVVLAQIGGRDRLGWNELGMLVFLALIIAAPLVLFDPEGGNLQVSSTPGETLGYATRAIGITVILAWILGVVALLMHKRLTEWNGARLVWGGAAGAAVLCLVVYFALGQPGFYGDKVFVILKDQADVSAAQGMTDYNARRQFVYETLTEHANQSQSGLRSTLDQFHIGYTPYYLVNAMEVSGDLPVQWWLGTRPEVDRILPSPHLRPLPSKPAPDEGKSKTPPSAPEWNLTLIGADKVWNELKVRGAGVIVGQSDSGADGTHPEIAAQYRGQGGSNDYNWLDPWYETTSPTDAGGHGTHTLGSILGKNVGVAPDAKWIGCVNLARNLGNPPLYLNCMQFMLAPYPQKGDALKDGDPSKGAMVLNNSWGCPDEEGCDPNALLAGVDALRDAGVFVVASAGNDGPGCSTIRDPIALYDDSFSVGAVGEDRRLADFSSRGPVEADKSGRVKPDIAAPGVEVLSSLPGGTYGRESGTSMAGPHIVGVVALMWSANPKLIGNIDATEKILRETAQPANLSGEKIVCGDPTATPNDLVGYGIVDAYAAVQRALAY